MNTTTRLTRPHRFARRVLMGERADSVCDAVAAWPDRLRTMSRDELDAWERDYEAGRETEPSADDLECGI